MANSKTDPVFVSLLLKVEFCSQKDEVCIYNDEICIKNGDFCIIQNDEL